MKAETVDVQNNEWSQAIDPWKNFYESLVLFTPDFMEERDLQTEPERESFD